MVQPGFAFPLQAPAINGERTAAAAEKAPCAPTPTWGCSSTQPSPAHVKVALGCVSRRVYGLSTPIITQELPHCIRYNEAGKRSSTLHAVARAQGRERKQHLQCLNAILGANAQLWKACGEVVERAESCSDEDLPACWGEMQPRRTCCRPASFPTTHRTSIWGAQCFYT